MKRFFKLGDIIVVTLVAALALFLVFLPMLFSGDGEMLKVTVNENGENKTARYPLSEDTSFNIENNGITLVVTVHDGAAFIEYSDCPAEICKHSGKISSRGESIVCVPAGVILTVEGGDADVGLVAG